MPPCNGKLVSGSGNAEPRGVFADASGVYWTNRGSGKIRRADLDGTNAADFVVGLSALGNLFGDDTFLYAPQYVGSGKIQRIRKSDQTVDTLVTIAGASELHGIDFIDGAFYFTTAVAGGGNGGRLFRYAPGDASATQEAMGLRDRLFSITHSGSTAYLISQGPSVGGNGGIIQSIDVPIVAPLTPTTVVMGLVYPIQAMTAEGYIYLGNADARTVERFAIGGFSSEIVANCQGAQTYGVWVHAGVAYYTCLDSNELRAVGLP